MSTRVLWANVTISLTGVLTKRMPSLVREYIVNVKNRWDIKMKTTRSLHFPSSVVPPPSVWCLNC